MRKWLLSLGLFFPLLIFANVLQTKLNNGLEVVIKPDHRSPVVLCSVWYKVGGSYEYSGITGLSHMLEHMMFRGTKQVPDGQFSDIVQRAGGSLNAFTTADYTGYYEYVPAQQLNHMLTLEADRMHNLVLKQALFAKEHQVVAEERRMRTDDNPQMSTYERYNAAAYINSPSHHPVVGWMIDIAHYTLNNLQHWYHTWYQPNNAIVVIVGDVNSQKALDMVKQHFAKIPAKAVPKMKPRTEVSSVGERSVIVKRPANVPWMIMGYLTPTVNTAKHKWEPYALNILAGILDGGDSARLQRDLVQNQQIASGVSAGYSLTGLYQSQFYFYGTPAKGHRIVDLKKALLSEIQQLKTKPVSQQELNKVKAQVQASYVYSQDSIMGQATNIGSYLSTGLTLKDVDQFVARSNAITPAQIQAVAKKYFRNDALTIAVLKPNGQPQKMTAAPQIGQGVH